MDKLLVVEDDQLLREGVCFALERENYLVYAADSLEAGRKYLNNNLGLVILDLGLPDGDGRELLKIISEVGKLPVIILTARASEDDMLESFDLGCDDYITKPFSTKVLLKHIRAVLKRTSRQNGNVYYQDDLTYDFAKKELCKDGEIITLTATEYNLLEEFLTHRNQVLTREVLLEAVWDNHGSYVDEKTLNVNIFRLREKLERNPKQPKYILTVFGLGYKWSDAND